MKKRFDAQNVHLIHHNAVLPDRMQLKAMEGSPDRGGRMKSPYVNPYENLPTKPNRVQSRDLNQQLRHAELSGINGAAGMITDLRKSQPKGHKAANLSVDEDRRNNFANVGIKSILNSSNVVGAG